MRYIKSMFYLLT